jgi:hypothetical protein
VDTSLSQGAIGPNATIKPSLRANGEISDDCIAPEVAQIEAAFHNNPSIRAGLCVAALHCGLPSMNGSNASADPAYLRELRRQTPAISTSLEMFSVENLRSKAVSVMGGEVQVPPAGAIRRYLDSVLLPHCLRICIMGNGPSTRNARASNGKFETAYGISYYPDCSTSRQSPLPDPCAPLASHSIEALACAFAILRRARLLRAAQHIVSGGVPLIQVMELLKSSTVRDSMDNLPVWWCPEIHDLGLLIHAATRGLFSILVDRNSHSCPGVFSLDMIKQHLCTRFVSNSALTNVFSNVSKDDVSDWMEDQARQFPSANTLERRLGLLCSVATAHLGDDILRYDSLPMWDHGSWPRK